MIKRKTLRQGILFSTAILATMACSMLSLGPTPTPRPTATNTPRPGPIPGTWGATIAFALPSGANVVQISFTVSPSGDQIEDWSIFDLATSSVSIGRTIPITGKSFEITNQEYVGNTNVSRSIKGTFTGPDTVEGTYDFSYGGYGSANGNWTGNPAKEKATPAPNKTAITPEIAQPTATKQPTIAKGAPIIQKVTLRKSTSAGGPIIYQDIYFIDSDGDVNRIDYYVVSSTVPDVQAQGGAVNIPSGQQKSGATITGTWNCGSSDYSVTLSAVLSDRAGHSSEPYEYTIVCGKG